MFRFLLTKLFSQREKMKGDDVKPFLEHLEDLRGTIFKMAATLVVAVSVSFIWNSQISDLLQYPLKVNGLVPADVLVAQDVIGPFMSSLTVSFYVGFAAAFPFLAFFLGQFVIPAMTDREKKYALPAIIVGFALFLGGAAFCFYEIVPGVIKFMADWSVKAHIKVQYAVGNYYKIVSLMCIIFGLLCQIPVVMISLHGVGIVTYKWISSTRTYGYTGILVLCGVVSPAPDVLSIVLITMPIIVLYEICIWVIYFLEKRKKPAEPAAIIAVAPIATSPYVEQSIEHHYDDPSHYNDDHHYHDDHYHREHPELADEPKPEPEVKPEIPPPATEGEPPKTPEL